ncbi:class F sortase [Streptomyces sp. NPDC057445]|uniref:class F sortase n=1 Tax=Streptomyces sp. NPDC057445 TaxID=3346136 RepID=UPI0036887ACB
MARSTVPVRTTRTLAVILLIGIYLLIQGLRGETAPQPSAAQAHVPPGAARAGPVRPTAHHPPTVRGMTGSRSQSVPVRLRIPAIKVNAPMAKAGLDKTGALKLPPAGKAGVAGWYAKGPAPGDSGTAVVAGHVDTPTGRAVFFSLGSLTKGSRIEITRKDRRTAVFTVDAVEVYSKKKFPTRKVYRSTAAPQLRIITCGGGYNRTSGYLGNTVVYASLTRTR